MSRVYDALKTAERNRRERWLGEKYERRSFRVVTVASNKGGVGKTTIATNLAVFVRALREDLPVLVLSLDDQTTIDRMFALDEEPAGGTIATALRTGHLAAAIRLGQYGVHYVAADEALADLKGEIQDTTRLQWVLLAAEWPGLVVIDTKSDLEILTRNALAAADLAILPVADHASLLEARKVFDLFETWERPQEHAKVVLSLVDRRIKYGEGSDQDILALLVAEIRRRGLPLFESFLSRSPKVESLYTNPEGRAHSILHSGPKSLVSLQMRHLAEDVLAQLYPAAGAPAEREPVAPPAQAAEPADQVVWGHRAKPEAGAPGARVVRRPVRAGPRAWLRSLGI